MRCVILGSGNVATHLATAFAGVAQVCQVWSRNKGNACRLAGECNAQVFADLKKVRTDADLYLIAVADDAIGDVARALPRVAGIVAHTSGSIGIDVLKQAGHKRTGVFYPLQTFSRLKPVDISRVPFFIEGNDPSSQDMLMHWARMLSDSVRPADSRLRARLHIAAVFACNFANRLWQTSEEILATEGLSLDVLQPLLLETVGKAVNNGARNTATGPAKRGDINVMSRQINSLAGDNRRLYLLLSRMILANDGNAAMLDGLD